MGDIKMEEKNEIWRGRRGLNGKGRGPEPQNRKFAVGKGLGKNWTQGRDTTY
jgi:hypothetical protein